MVDDWEKKEGRRAERFLFLFLMNVYAFMLIMSIIVSDAPTTTSRMPSFDSAQVLDISHSNDLPPELRGLPELSGSAALAALTFNAPPSPMPPRAASPPPRAASPFLPFANTFSPTFFDLIDSETPTDAPSRATSPDPAGAYAHAAFDFETTDPEHDTIADLGGMLASASAKEKDKEGSMALRAMRSVRSMARIGSISKMRSVPSNSERDSTAAEATETESDRERRKGGKRTRPGILMRSPSGEGRSHTSLFTQESAAEVPPPAPRTLGRKKKSVLAGLNWPGTLRASGSAAANRLPTAPAALAVVEPKGGSHPPSAFDARRLPGQRVRGGSHGTVSSTDSSVRPLSTLSGGSQGSCRSSSAASVRWDEEGLASVKEARMRERAARAGTRMAKLFVEDGTEEQTPTEETEMIEPMYDGLSIKSAPEVAGPTTPTKKRKARPVSEELPGTLRSRALADPEGKSLRLPCAPMVLNT